MSKDAIMVAVDAGSSMDQLFSDHATRLKIALQCLKLTLQQKLFNNASHQIGFSLFGDDQSDDGQNLLLQDIQKPTLQLVRKVVKMSQAKLGNKKQGGDIFSAIEFVTTTIANHCQNKKFNKRAFIFTSGRGSTKYSKENLRGLVNQLKKNSIKLNIIPLDFMETYDIENNKLQQVTQQPNQQTNADMLIQMRSMEMENIQIFPASLAIELYKKFRKRDTNPVALYRGNLQIAPGLQIQVATYKAIRKQRLKSLAKYDMTKQFDPKLTKQKQITTQITYIVQGDKTGTLVDIQNRTNAYPYGPHLIPISEIMENGMKIFQQKNFKLLGFVDKSKIPRQCFMSQVDMVIPSQDPLSRKLFTSFIYSMLSLNRYAIARYVPRNNKKGVSPKLVVLIPFRSADRQLFYLIEMPTAEDVRDYSFNSLKKSTQKQQQYVKQLIQKMNLCHKQAQQQIQQLKVQNTFNPLRQHFFQSIFHRALNQDGQLPDLDPTIKNYLKPQQRIFQVTQNLINNIKKQFKLNKKELGKDKLKQKKTVMWKDILMIDQKSQQDNSIISTDVEDKIVLSKKFNFQDEEDDCLDPKMPIVSFRKMLNNNKKDLVETALNGMKEYIEGKISTAVNEETIMHMVECARELRKGCISQKETKFWDDWFEQCQPCVGTGVYQKMKEQGLGFIEKSNAQVYKAVEFHQLDAQIDDLD